MTKASSSNCSKEDRLKTSGYRSAKQSLPKDDFLESDSEIDEFAGGYQPGFAERVSDDDDEDGGGSESGHKNDENDDGHGNAQWEPDDWDEDGDVVSDSENESEQSGMGNESEEDENNEELKQLQKNLDSLPLSALAKAQKSLSRKTSSSFSSSSSKEEKLVAVKAKLSQIQRNKGKTTTFPELHMDGRVNQGNKDQNPDSDSEPETESFSTTKRSNKHAPTAMSTKNQVSRRRQVIDTAKPDRRDPRFSSVSAGKISADAHVHSYAFLPDLLKDELASLKEQVNTAKKVEKTCLLSEKPMRTAEREALELQLGKVRTKLVRSEKDQLERQALAQAKKQEKEKQSQGKGAWYMKKSEKRDLLLKAKFQDLEKHGGKTAVKKLVEKKRKKIASKEKKSRPFMKSTESVDGDKKRRRMA
ncbi:uncharacterized protein L203_105178 [Cryptococcus depauperatus CBS 7841]|uniref:rRNA biogenesis protein RRP36 n=1 Tax=Cryptococcus depauperatus CBS 7841 TaxID=1295531 RepID=A0AAJ8JWV3_9TREE